MGRSIEFGMNENKNSPIRADRRSWKIERMPNARALIPFDRQFSSEDYERLKFGLIPEEMEDRWFIFMEGGWLFFHRSWTGYCIYQVRFERENDHCKIVEAWVNRDRRQYSQESMEKDQRLLNDLLDCLLRNRRF